MKVNKTIDLGHGHKIEIGLASWDNTKTSIRNRYPTASGGFSPHSSSELPIEDLPILIIEAINNGLINKSDLKNIINTAVKSL